MIMHGVFLGESYEKQTTLIGSNLLYSLSLSLSLQLSIYWNKDTIGLSHFLTVSLALSLTDILIEGH